MVKDDQARSERQLPKGVHAFSMTVLALIAVLTASGFIAARWLLHPKHAEAMPADAVAAAPPASSTLFPDWPKPDVVVVLSAEQHGYLQPCGCTEPQKGGLARRFNLIRDLRRRQWPVVAGDLGDIAQRSGPQALLKYKYSMLALKLLDYTAVGIGANEMALPLFNALGEYALNNPSPRVVSANLKEKETKFPEMVGSTIVRVGEEAVPRVGFAGVVGPSVAKLSQDPDARFDPEEGVLPAALAELQKQKAELLVLLYQGSVDEAKACAQRFPAFQVILCLDKDDEPSARPERVGNTMIIGLGHKCKYVGVVGGYRGHKQGAPFELRYELVAVSPEFETPDGKDKDNPIHALLQSYAEEVRKGNYLAKYVQNANHPVQIAFPGATYAGSEQCKKCHAAEYAIWEASPHPHAYETLVNKAKRPTLRQHDGECIVCHVTGFGYASGFTDAEKTPLLKGVGCESCHGPASLHVASPKNKPLRAALNPWKANAKNRANSINLSCQKCHDLDNSVNFKFEKYWEEKKIKH